MRTRNAAALISLMLLMAMTVPVSAQQGTIGIVADDNTDSAIVFDAETDTVLGSVSVGPGSAIGDCSITQDQSLGFVTDFNHRIWVIDLTTSPPSLAAGTNPIPISNSGEDTTITPDGQFLLVSDGSFTEPISVIDIASRTEINTFSLGSDHNSVEALSDGSVLVTSLSSGTVRRLTVDDAGNLTDTGDVLSFSQPNNTFGPPGAESGIAIGSYPGEIRSFAIPGLTPVDTRSLTGGGYGISGLVNPAGDRVYARSNGGAVDVFDYDAATGALGAVALFSIPTTSTTNWFGIDQMAITPDGSKLYVSEMAALNVYDASTGDLLTAITHSQLVQPSGVCLSAAQQLPVGGYVVPVNRLHLLAPWVTLASLGFLVFVGSAMTIKKLRT